MKASRRPLKPILLLAILSLAGGMKSLGAQGIEKRIRDNQERLNSIKQERTRLQNQLDQLRNRVHNITGELNNLQLQKGATSRIVNELDRQIGSLTAALDTTSRDLVVAGDALSEKRAILTRRLTDIYKRGRLWTFQVLLTAENFGDLVSRYKYLYVISRQDRALVSEVDELKSQIESQRNRLLRLRNQLAQSRSERGLELARYDRLESIRRRSLSRVRVSEQKALERIETLSTDERNLNDIIAGLIRSRREAAARGSPGIATITSADIGALDWPARGEVIYRFGPYKGPNNTTLRRHGIGIRLPVGTPVKTVAGGVVAYAQAMGIYGLTVIIDHGGEFFTLYQHLARIDVANRTRVTRGSVIGLSGGGESDLGPHLGFQIRQGQLRLDPENWLRGRN